MTWGDADDGADSGGAQTRVCTLMMPCSLQSVYLQTLTFSCEFNRSLFVAYVYRMGLATFAWQCAGRICMWSLQLLQVTP
jgi:hypothetical protein